MRTLLALVVLAFGCVPVDGGPARKGEKKIGNAAAVAYFQSKGLQVETDPIGAFKFPEMAAAVETGIYQNVIYDFQLWRFETPEAAQKTFASASKGRDLTAINGRFVIKIDKGKDSLLPVFKSMPKLD